MEAAELASVTIVAVLVFYLVVLLALGWWAGRESGSVAGYYVAGKQLPSWVIAFSSNSTGESAWLLLGLTGMGYTIGIHALWIVLGEVLGVALVWTLVAQPFKTWTDRYDSITVPDYLEARFRDSSHVIRWLSLLIIMSMVTAYTAAQLTAAGKAFASFLDISYVAGALLGAAVVLYYTTVGGFKAVAYSDLLQGILMLGGLFLLPFVAMSAAGGWTATMAQLNATDPALLRPMGSYGMSVEGFVSVIGFIGIGLAFLGAPQLLSRFIAARSRRDILEGGLIAVPCIILFDVGAVFGGMAGRVIFPVLDDPETILPVITSELMPAVFTGVYLVIVLAAIMSTADSLLIMASATVVRDIVQRIYRPNEPERRLALYGKATTVVVGIVALLFALGEVRVIFWFVLFAGSGLACAFTPVVLCSLYWKRTTRAGAIAGMIGGFLTAIVWVLAFKPYTYDLYELIPGFIVGFGLTIGVSLLTEPPEGAAEEFDEVWQEIE